MNKTEEANSEHHYIILVIAIIIGVGGIYLRFADFKHVNIVANIILLTGLGIALRTVANILKP